MIRRVLAAASLWFISACAALVTPVLEPIPTVPLGRVAVESGFFDENGCPDIAGEYFEVPTVFAFSKDMRLLREYEGSRNSYIELFRVGRRADEITTRANVDDVVKDSERRLSVKQASITFLDVTVAHLSAPVLLTYHLESREQDYICKNGFVVIPEHQMKGGGDGVRFNFRIYRHASATKSGDLLFYEQWHNRGDIEHRYYLYRRDK